MTIYKHSFISSLPKIISTILLIIRNLKQKKINLSKFFISDGVITKNNMSVVETERIKYSIETAIKNCGWDYQIPMRLHQAIWCLDSVLSNTKMKQSSIVELGTGRGFVMSGILASRDFIGAPIQNPIFLFDTFLPYYLGANNEQTKLNGINRHYAISLESTKRNFSKWNNINIIQGTLPESVKNTKIESVGFLHIDLNNPEIELTTLKYLWPKIEIGGIILIDDYGAIGYQETYKVFNLYSTEIGSPILTTAFGQGIMIKTH